MIAPSQDSIALLVSHLGNGDPRTIEKLLERSYTRLQQLTRLMLRDFPAVRRWEETDDVWQTAAIRFQQALAETEPESPRHFFRLAGRYIRRTLIDLARKHNGAQGLGTNLSPAGLAAVDHAESIASVGPESNCPQRLAQWTEFHRQVESLPEVEREVFDLLWYAELTQQEAADCIGISVRSVKRRWRSARLLLATELEDSLPDGWGGHLGSAPTVAQAK